MTEYDIHNEGQHGEFRQEKKKKMLTNNWTEVEENSQVQNVTFSKFTCDGTEYDEAAKVVSRFN